VDAINSTVQISQVEEVFLYIRLESLCFFISLMILLPAFDIRADLTQLINQQKYRVINSAIRKILINRFYQCIGRSPSNVIIDKDFVWG
jgi:hypothetical protein